MSASPNDFVPPPPEDEKPSMTIEKARRQYPGYWYGPAGAEAAKLREQLVKAGLAPCR